jgi:PD-(D/E)XK endonuclease
MATSRQPSRVKRLGSTLHTKDAGTVGELAVILQLKQAGFTVFTEVGDNSPIDLIVLCNGRLLRGQVKSCKLSNGTATLALRKAGPNGYLRKYRDDPTGVDFFALYVHDTGQIAYISASEAYRSCPGSTRLVFRVAPPRNNQARRVRYLENYADFEGVLRDYEQRT